MTGGSEGANTFVFIYNDDKPQTESTNCGLHYITQVSKGMGANTLIAGAIKLVIFILAWGADCTSMRLCWRIELK